MSERSYARHYARDSHYLAPLPLLGVATYPPRYVRAGHVADDVACRAGQCGR